MTRRRRTQFADQRPDDDRRPLVCLGIVGHDDLQRGAAHLLEVVLEIVDHVGQALGVLLRRREGGERLGTLTFGSKTRESASCARGA